MLKNIRFHIDQDEDQQRILETNIADRITHTQNKNINAFQRYMPSLLGYLEGAKSQNISLFCNQRSEFNIVDYGQGRVFYGFEPEWECKRQVELFLQHAPYISLEEYQPAVSESDITPLQRWSQFGELPSSPEVVVVFGLGLGHHIKELVVSRNIRHLIIYEPELQYFGCSTMAGEWKDILSIAKQKNTQIYLQLEKDGRNLVDDLTELKTHYGIQGAYFYKHYNHLIFDALVAQLSSCRWESIVKNGLKFDVNESADAYCPAWTYPVDLLTLTNVSDSRQQEDSLFIKNLQAFERFFPEIYKQFKDYIPKRWRTVTNANGEINLINKENLVCWYGDHPKKECLLSYEDFCRYPNKDGLALGYSGEKLKKYHHYQFVKKTELIMEGLKESHAELPDQVKSMIMFGIGNGYQLAHLMESKRVEKLFLCEPNSDFFYASLHAIDWAKILSNIDASGGRLYINIGDDGTNLFRDLLSQFYSIGPYILSHTYFYQAYYNSPLQQAISQLREQLQIVISMGEYFDHARYGIAHTKRVLNDSCSLLRANPDKYLSFDNKEVPVFLVGNGPSLDQSIRTIKSLQDIVIVVSCGTALQALYKNGITPDYHAEIEQNRSTYDWVSRVGDYEYLKHITLISCNGIHPDTCNLFKQVMISFKEGESSTVSALSVVGEKSYEVLQYAFPTVSNFGLNMFLKLGFSQLYLFGVDLGFKDNSRHHSSDSGYFFENGKTIYDYSNTGNNSIKVKGNFANFVYTKHEFKVAKYVMEQSLASKRVSCYNTSDGAFIAGTLQLDHENILVVSTGEDKQAAISAIEEQAFSAFNQGDYAKMFENKFDAGLLIRELKMFSQKVLQAIDDEISLDTLIDAQKSMLFASYAKGRSALFYYLYGSTNYANAVFSKLDAIEQNQSKATEDIKLKLLNAWKDTLDDFIDICSYHLDELEHSIAFSAKRIYTLLDYKLTGKRLLVVTDSERYIDAVRLIIVNKTSDLDVEFMHPADYLAGSDCPFDYVLFHTQDTVMFLKNYQDRLFEKIQNCATPTLILSQQLINEETLRAGPGCLSFYVAQYALNRDSVPLECNYVDFTTFSYFFLLETANFDVFFQKYTVPEDFSVPGPECICSVKDCSVYDCDWVEAISFDLSKAPPEILQNGIRPRENGQHRGNDGLVLKKMESDEFNETKSDRLIRYENLLMENNCV